MGNQACVKNIKDRKIFGSAKKYLIILFCLCVLFILCGCQEEAEPELEEPESPMPVQEIREAEEEKEPDLPEWFALPYEPNSTLDPITCPDGMQRVVASLMYEGLFKLNYNLEPQNWLCESYDRNGDCSMYTFQLRDGVLFSDGSPLTAADVRNSIERARDSERYGQRLRQISWIYVEDNNAITIGLTESNSGFPALLDIPISRNVGSVPLGTGPYGYLWEEYGSWLIANPYWWTGGNRPVERIRLDESQGAMLYRFSSRDVHLISTSLIGSGEIPAGLTGDIRYQDAPDTALHYLACNSNSEIMQNAAFRRALSLGINRENLVSAFLSGHAAAAQFPVSPVCDLYPSDMESAYSPFTFASALSESGYEAGRNLILLVNAENSFKISMAKSIAESFTIAGVPMETRVLPWDEYQASLYGGDYDLCYCEARLTADWNLWPLLGGGNLNIGGWWDGWLIGQMETFAASNDRVSAMRDLCEAIRTQAVILPICFGNTSVLMHADVVENLRPTAAEPFYNLTECAIHTKPAA